MESLEKLNEQLKKHLESISPFLITDFQSLINGENIVYFDGIQQSDVAAFNFEYRHDYLDTTFFGTDKEGIKITGDVGLLIRERSVKFLPQAIWDRVNDIEDDEGIEDIEEALEEYNDEKYEIFDDWFSNCWKVATKGLENPVTAYFSISELDFGIELNSYDMVDINKDQPNKRHYIL